MQCLAHGSAERQLLPPGGVSFAPQPLTRRWPPPATVPVQSRPPAQGVIIELPACRGSGRERRLEGGEKGQEEAGGSQGSRDPKDTLEGPVTTAWRELGAGGWTQGEQAAAAEVLQTWADSAAPCVRALMCVSMRACREDPTWGRFSDSVVEKWGHLGSGCSR